jgi:beta-glucosidase-like glycosyl hydrolase
MNPDVGDSASRLIGVIAPQTGRLFLLVALSSLVLLPLMPEAQAAWAAGPASTAVPCNVSAVGTWSVAQRLNQLVMVGGQFSDLGASASAASAGVGGFVLFGQPPAGSGPTIQSGLSALSADAAAAERVVPWMSTDEEGGHVARLADVIGSLPTPRQMATQWSASQVRAALAAQGSAMRSLGISVDLAPVLDTASPNNTIADENDRSFSENGQVAAAYGLAFANGLRSSRIVPVVKHFPGLGHASADTDLGPATDPSLSQLETNDLIPFEQAISAGLPVVMVGHPSVPGLTGGAPASLSPATYQFLRDNLHFAGVALTDSLAAGAISAAGYSEASGAVAAAEAGADMVMIDALAWQPTLGALERAVSSGALPLAAVNASVTRIVAAKGLQMCSGIMNGDSKTVSWGSGRLDVFARATDGSLLHKWWDGTAWHDWESLGGRIVGDPAPVASGFASLDVFVRGIDNHLWLDSYRTTSGWQWSEPGGTLAASPASVSPAPGQADAFVEGADLALWHWSSTSGWSAALGGSLAGEPTAVSSGGGHLDVFVEQADQALWQWSNVSGWARIGGRLAAPPSAVSWGSPRLDVFVQGIDDGLWHAWYDAGWHWEGLGGVLAAPPAAVTWGVNRLDIFVRGTDNALWHAYSDGGGWTWENRQGQLISRPDPVSWSAGRLDVFSRGSDANLWHTWYESTWHPFEVLS